MNEQAEQLPAALAHLVTKHGDLGVRLDSLRPIQQQEIAEVAYDHGFLVVMEALAVPLASLERCMRASGYEQCTGECEAWFGALELDDLKRCGDCSDADDFYLRQAKMKAADEARGLEAIKNAPRMLTIEEIHALNRGDMATILRIEKEIEAAASPAVVTELHVDLAPAEPAGPSGN